LLIGLFFYDIFWVFGTDVMTTVAKSFEAPVKVLSPEGNNDFLLLGLGDIVIPGIFIALMLRFDRHLSKLKSTRLKRTYFNTSFVAYIFSLVCCIGILHFFKHGQPGK
jgi:minor histocompatibility antigen H13